MSSKSKFTETFRNDIYGQFCALAKPEHNPITTQIIHPATEKHKLKYSAQNMYFVYETAEDYKNITLPFLEKQQLKIEVWLYLHFWVCCFTCFVLIGFLKADTLFVVKFFEGRYVLDRQPSWHKSWKLFFSDRLFQLIILKTVNSDSIDRKLSFWGSSIFVKTRHSCASNPLVLASGQE